MQKIRYILLPFALLYGLVVTLIRFCYHKKIFKRYKSNIPIINIGNLSTGGTGKTPHVAYLMEYLAPLYPLVVLSRGYNRKTKDVLWVNPDSTATAVGDEPLQLKKQFPNIPIIVAKKRASALPLIQKEIPDTAVILLDDALQHWALYSPIKILLTTFEQPFFEDFVLPAGNLREFRSGYQRADIIIITKCPNSITQAQKHRFERAVSLKKHQKMFFSYYQYGQPKAAWGTASLTLTQLKELTIIMVTAIANTSYLEEYIHPKAKRIIWLNYPDHHYFREKDIKTIVESYHNEPSEQKIILTTEKDLMRLQLHQDLIKKHKLPIYSLAIKVAFAFGEEQRFQQTITTLLKQKR